METAIDSMYDLWDATVGIAGVFEGLWKAADAGGSTGLDGFAKMMLRWKEVVNSADFQKGLTAIFRGSRVAMEAFGDAIGAVGRLFTKFDGQIERFIGSAGNFFAGIIEEVFSALADSPRFAEGLTGLSMGLDLGLEKLAPALQPIADTFGSFLDLVGDLAENVLPAAAGAFADLMPAVDGIISTVQDVLPDLSTAITDIAETLGPALKDFVDTAGPVLAQALSDVADILVEVAPILADLVGVISDMLGSLGITKAVRDNQKAFEASGLAPKPGDFDNPFAYYQEYVKKAQEFMDSKPFTPKLGEFDIDQTKAMITTWYEGTVEAFENGGYKGAAAFWKEYELNSLDPAVRDGVIKKLEALGYDLDKVGADSGGKTGGSFGSKTAEGIRGTSPLMTTAAREAIIAAREAAAGVSTYSVGANMAGGIVAGINANAWRIASSLIGAANGAMVKVNRDLGIQSPSKKLAKKTGKWMPLGVAKGIDDNASAIQRSMSRAVNVDLPGLRGRAGQAATGIGAQKTVNVNIHNPHVRDLHQELAEAVDMAGVMS